MPKRAFYKVDADVDLSDVRDAVVVGETTKALYVHSAISPNESVLAIGGVLIAHTWVELHAALTKSAAKAVFHAVVEREEGPEGETVTVRERVPMSKKRTGDVVIIDNLIPHAWGRAESVAEQQAVDRWASGL